MIIDLDSLRATILESEDLKQLYEIQIDLSRSIANCHRGKREAQTESEVSELQGTLGTYIAIREVLTNRIPEIKEKQYNEANQEQRLNYNFRMAAKLMLKKETYQSIMNEAHKPRRDVKENYRELKSNKIE